MKPIDYRNKNWDQVWSRAAGDQVRAKVYCAFLAHGPGTTKRIAAKADIDLLSFRPRTTELFDLGLVELASEEPAREGLYRAVPYEVAQQRYELKQAEARAAQLHLGL